MTTLNAFKALRASVPAEVRPSCIHCSAPAQTPPAKGWWSWQRTGVTLTLDQVRQFLQQMDSDSDFDDIELDAVALLLAGGQ